MGVTRKPSGVPAGTIAYFAMNAAPHGWIKANGATISRTTYAALFNAVGTFAGIGDGSTTFVLPDLRGEFIRCFDDGRGLDPGRHIGSWQDSQMQRHSHSNFVANGQSIPAIHTTAFQVGSSSSVTSLNDINKTIPEGGSSNGSENRPRNVSYLACIKF